MTSLQSSLLSNGVTNLKAYPADHDEGTDGGNDVSETLPTCTVFQPS